MGFLHGKRALVTGIISQRSIAWGIANAMHREGAQLAFTYVDEKLKDRVDEAATAFGSNIVLPCDVSRDEDINALFDNLGKHWDGFDILIHSIGFAPREALTGEFLEGMTRENFRIAHDISSFSLAAMANYNVMGLAKASLEANVRYLAFNLGPEGTRVNAISAGPIKTLAAAGIANFRKMLDHVDENAPLRRSVTIDEVGNAAAFLCSDLASGITGEVTSVDAGYNTLGMTGL